MDIIKTMIEHPSEGITLIIVLGILIGFAISQKSIQGFIIEVIDHVKGNKE